MPTIIVRKKEDWEEVAIILLDGTEIILESGHRIYSKDLLASLKPYFNFNLESECEEL